MPGTIQVSQKALGEIKRLAGKRRSEGKDTAALRIGMRGGGCTGFSYLFEWAEGPPSTRDQVIALEEGLAIYVDPKSMIYLQGTELDFVTSMMGYGFKFNNPNTKGSCGCGESVQF